jgi:hypothetical protein
MNISKNIVIAMHTGPSKSLTLAAGESKVLNQPGKYFLLKSNSIASKVDLQVAIGSDSLNPWPVLFSAQVEKEGEFFDKVRVHNPSATDAMTIEYVISNLVISNRGPAITGVGGIKVEDVSYVCSTIRDSLDTLKQLEGLHVVPNKIQPDLAAITDEGAGKIGIPITNNPFFNNGLGCNYVGQSVKVYLGAGPAIGYYSVEAGSTSSKLVITETYGAYTCQAGDYVSLRYPKKVAANDQRRELIVYNPSDLYDCYWGSLEIGWDSYTLGGQNPLKGNAIAPKSSFVITCQDDIYFVADDGFGANCAILQINELKTV